MSKTITITSIILDDVIDAVLAANPADNEAIHLYHDGTVATGTDYKTTTPSSNKAGIIAYWTYSPEDSDESLANVNWLPDGDLLEFAQAAGEADDTGLRNALLMLVAPGKLEDAMDGQWDWTSDDEGDPALMGIVPMWDGWVLLSSGAGGSFEIIEEGSIPKCYKRLQVERLQWISQIWEEGSNEISPEEAVQEILNCPEAELYTDAVWTGSKWLGAAELEQLVDRLEQY